MNSRKSCLEEFCPNSCVTGHLQFYQCLVHVHGDFHRNKDSTNNLANSTMKKKKKKNSVRPLLISLSSFFFLFQLLQGRQCLFKVRSVLSTGTVLEPVLFERQPPITLVMVIFLWGQMVGMIFVRK